MLTSNIKSSWRSLIKDRQFTLLNLAGLSIALTCVLFIVLWVNSELAVDKFHENNSRLYQVMSHIKLPDGIHTQENTPALLGRAMAKEMPEIERAVSVQESYGKEVLSAGSVHIKTKRAFADNDFFNLFSFSLTEGNKNKLFADKYSVLLSDKLAMKLFHTTSNLVGKTVRWENDPQNFNISGIFKEPEGNSSLQFESLFSYEYFYQANPENSDWANSNPSTFLLVRPGTDINNLESQLTGFLHAKYDRSPLTLSLRKYSDRYLYGKYDNGIQAGGRIRYVRLFSSIALFILLIACINFMNLSTAKAARKLKEAGIKKMLGAGRRSLILQYLCEALMMAFASLLFATALVILLMPAFNQLTGKELAIRFSSAQVLALFGIGSITGLLAGSYPAFYLSGFKPLTAVKGKPGSLWGELWLRKGLVVFQYSLSVIFIIAVMVIYKQMDLLQTIDLGFNKDHIISFKNENAIQKNYGAFLSDIKNIPGVLTVSSIDGDMYGNTSGSTEKAEWDGNIRHEKILFTALDIDYGLIELLGMRLTEGRSFSKSFASDSSAIMLNEAAVHAMGIKDPIGKTFTVWGTHYHIIGIAKDFHFESLYEKVKPCFMRCAPSGGNILVKIAGGQERNTVAGLRSLFRNYRPGIPFEYSFLDKDYENLYVAEERESILLRWFAALAIVISCLGLFGLAAFSAQKRQKEMSIRKVVGASSERLMLLLSQDFLKLTGMAVLISFPLSWWLMNKWLDDFAYRVHIGPAIFILTFLSVIVITLLTVSYQAIKTALANPVNSLRAD